MAEAEGEYKLKGTCHQLSFSGGLLVRESRQVEYLERTLRSKRRGTCMPGAVPTNVTSLHPHNTVASLHRWSNGGPPRQVTRLGSHSQGRRSWKDSNPDGKNSFFLGRGLEVVNKSIPINKKYNSVNMLPYLTSFLMCSRYSHLFSNETGKGLKSYIKFFRCFWRFWK